LRLNLHVFAVSHTVNGMRSTVQSGQKGPVHLLETVYELQWDSHELTYRTAGGQWEFEGAGVVWQVMCAT
jgi:hypothetical protein